ncbi:G-type lectin S-receptor-like serine/threonine-protein kinase CES101 isoform X1 [Senna tora]|uniref:G-type lectin S-receptor-like serine/threonine-protein kinase CES101 isoform X1 n=1 Tax=Senna tora TaxID=362788 RepID=A0A835CKE3_9FABA|nr:G-type lectin S-receptor-like serine/threonine-protein kinase CES101 isoform X1 [Senna tora]
MAVCSSVVRDDSLDYPLLVPTNSYVYTANGCVRCKCDAAYYNWTLQCEPSHLKPTNWSTCPSMQCNISSNMYIIGSTTHSGSHNVTFCAYSGYGNQTIFTTLATGVTLPDNSDRVHSGKGNSIDHKQGRWWIWLVVVAVIAIPILFYLCNLIWKKYKTKVDRKRKQKKLIWEIGGGTIASTLYNKAKGNTKDGKTNHEMRIFSFESIVAATNEFSIANKLGEGGFGPVYKLVLLCLI